MTKSMKTLLYNENDQLDFFNSYKKMSEHFGCYYMGYILEDTNKDLRSGFTTNMDWGKEYLNNYIKHCHLYSHVQRFFSLDSKSNTLILPWHTISTTTSIQEEAFLRKEELLISRDGISFCYKAGSLREYYYFAPQINERRFLEHVSSSLNIIKEEIKIFRKHSISLIQAVESNKTTTSEEK